jgi:hypothetical protein
MLTQDAPHFFNGFRVALRRVAGAHHFFRLHAFDVGALVSDHTVGFSGDRAVAEHGNVLRPNGMPIVVSVWMICSVSSVID